MMPRLRHRQTKGAATVERYLPPPRQSSTLPETDGASGRDRPAQSSIFNKLVYCAATQKRVISIRNARVVGSGPISGVPLSACGDLVLGPKVFRKTAPQAFQSFLEPILDISLRLDVCFAILSLGSPPLKSSSRTSASNHADSQIVLPSGRPRSRPTRFRYGRNLPSNCHI
jgi:hypothetical protein